MRDNSIIVGLDIGTTKITTVIGEVMPGGTVDIIGEGTVSSEGMKRGSVVNLERATHAIRQSVQAAERVSGVKVHSVFVSVAGNHAKAITSHGLAAIRRQQEIIQSDVDRAIENARAVPIDPNLEILHTLPQEYVVDGQEGIKNPVGMHGVRLEVDVHIVAGTAGPLLNLRRCVQEAGLQVGGFVLHVLSSGLATLEASEQLQNTLVIDMGGGTTDVGLFKRGNLAYSASIPIGGDHVTADLAQILKIPLEEAENVKLRYGAALPEMADQNLTLEITSANGSVHVISAFELSRIIKPRISEIYSLIRDEVDQALGPIELVAQSVVLTGGAAHLRGAVPLARDRFRLPARFGKPRGISGLSDIVSGPSHACGVGMVLYGIAQDGKVPVSVFSDAHVIPADSVVRPESGLAERNFARTAQGAPAEPAAESRPTEPQGTSERIEVRPEPDYYVPSMPAYQPTNPYAPQSQSAQSVQAQSAQSSQGAQSTQSVAPHAQPSQAVYSPTTGYDYSEYDAQSGAQPQGQSQFASNQQPYDPYAERPYTERPYERSDQPEQWSNQAPPYGQQQPYGQPYKDEAEKPSLMQRVRAILKDWF